MMKKFIYLSAFATVLFAAQSCNDSKKAKNFNHKTSVDGDGYRFILTANEAGLTEIKAAELAQKNSVNPRVINFAKMIVADHTSAENDLKKLADDKNVTVSDTLSQEHQKMIAELTKQTGVSFDKAYLQMAKADHQKAIDLFRTAAENTDRKLIKYSDRVTPTLKMHLDSATAILASLK